MLMAEESRILGYLRKHCSATAADLARVCLGGVAPDWVGRAVAHLEWLGYVTLFYGPDAKPAVVQITDRGLAHAAGGGVSASG
jgi:hypothetical protein